MLNQFAVVIPRFGRLLDLNPPSLPPEKPSILAPTPPAQVHDN